MFVDWIFCWLFVYLLLYLFSYNCYVDVWVFVWLKLGGNGKDVFVKWKINFVLWVVCVEYGESYVRIG